MTPALQRLYAKIPNVECRRLCGGAYCGPVPFVKGENCVREGARVIPGPKGLTIMLSPTGPECPNLCSVTKTCNVFAHPNGERYSEYTSWPAVWLAKTFSNPFLNQ